MVELPLVVVDVQRGGPSTGLPTKTEQADLLQALFGRNGESPVPVLAASSPADCFDARDRGLPDRGAVHDAGDPALRRLPRQRRRALAAAGGRGPAGPSRSSSDTDPEGFLPYRRDATTLARPWAIPGTPGLEHRIGGLEKQDGTGNVTYDPDNHEHMVRTARGEGRAHRRRPPRARGPRRRAGGRPARRRLGLDLRRDHRRGQSSRGARGSTVVARPPAPPQPVPQRISARSWLASSTCWCPR